MLFYIKLVNKNRPANRPAKIELNWAKSRPANRPEKIELNWAKNRPAKTSAKNRIKLS